MRRIDVILRENWLPIVEGVKTGFVWNTSLQNLRQQIPANFLY